MPSLEASIASDIATNLEHLRNEIADACARAQRPTSEVALMAVSKMHPAEALQEAYAAGQRLFGENRVQEWQSKSELLAQLSPGLFSQGTSVEARAPAPGTMVETPSEFQVHLIGPLQNNKTARAAELFHAVDTIDSLKTAQRLDSALGSARSAPSGRRLAILIEVKLSPEETKHGIAPGQLPTLLAAVSELKHLRLDGLMTVPPWNEDPETARPYFQQLRRLRDEHQAMYPTLTQLSMGMSNDFRVAIEEGSNTVRIGTAIFGKRIPRV